MRTMIHSANANYDKKKGIVNKADFLVSGLNWIIIRIIKMIMIMIMMMMIMMMMMMIIMMMMIDQYMVKL